MDLISRHCISTIFFIFVFFCLLFSTVFSIYQDNQIIANNESKKMKLINTHLKKINKPFVKSINSPDGDIIDCVLFHMQPAFDLPELKSTVSLNIPQEPSNGHSSSTRMELELKQKWSSNGESCPNGTIPIRRTMEDDILRSNPISNFGKKFDTRFKTNSLTKGHEYAIGSVEGEYYGVNASLNVWASDVTDARDFSLSQIWLANKDPTYGMNTIEAGWQVNPSRSGDYAARLFIYWTSDGYRKSGCYNLLCSGFVQTDKKVAFGAAIEPISTYNALQYDIRLLIWKEPNTKNWYLRVGSIVVGYWPSTLFTTLQEHAARVDFGGEIFTKQTSGSHTSNQMGSGHFPDEGYGKAAYVRSIEVVDRENKLSRVSNMILYADKPYCYNVTSGSDDEGEWGSYIYYGGPGFNPNCP